MVGQEARVERMKRGLTLRQVAAQMGVAPSRVHAIEHQGELSATLQARVVTAIMQAADARERELSALCVGGVAK